MADPTPEPTAAHPEVGSLPYVDPIPPETPLCENNFHEVANFTCGKAGVPEKRWEADVSSWIKNRGPGGALDSIRLNLAEVWLYHCPTDGRLVGYGSLGEDNLPIGDDGSIGMALLPYLGLHTAFRGQQDCPKERRYGPRILGGLIEELARRNKHEYVMLYADPENPAIALYESFRFRKFDEWTDPEDNRLWVRMFRRIHLRSSLTNSPSATHQQPA